MNFLQIHNFRLYKVMYEDDHAAMVYKKILDDLDREPKEISVDLF